MDLLRFLELAHSHGWRGMALWGVLLAQALLWIGLARLHLAIHREQVPWEECVGKIRSAFLRKANGQEEMEELKIHHYAPLVDALVALHFKEARSEVFIRWILMRVEDEGRPASLLGPLGTPAHRLRRGRLVPPRPAPGPRVGTPHEGPPATLASCGSGWATPWCSPGGWNSSTGTLSASSVRSWSPGGMNKPFATGALP